MRDSFICSPIHLHFSLTREHTHSGVKQRGVRRARAAEEAVLGHQVFVSIHCILHVLAADQAAEQSVVGGRWQVHAVIPLGKKNAHCDQTEHLTIQSQTRRTQDTTSPG